MQITTLFPIEVGGNDRCSCYRRLPGLFTSPYDTARGFSAASVSTAVSNTASKGDRLTSKHPSSAREAAGPQQTSAKHSGKIPIGCETAFSKLAHRADLSARRCIT